MTIKIRTNRMLKKMYALFLLALGVVTGMASPDEVSEKKQSHQVKALSLPATLSLGFEAWAEAVGNKHPQFFGGREDINFPLVEWVRNQVQAKGEQVFLEKKETALQQVGIRIVKKFAPDLELPTDISLAELHYGSLLAAFRMKPPSELERSIFNSLPDNKEYRELQMLAENGETFPFRRSLIELAQYSSVTPGGRFPLKQRHEETEFFPEKSWETTYSSSVSYDLVDEVERLLPCSLPWPTNGGELGLAFLVRAFMKDVYPLGLSQQDVGVHGMTFTPGSLAWHDNFHGELSRHRRRFVPWVMSVLSKAPNQKVSAPEFLKRAGPRFRKQYGLVMEIYDYLYQQTTGLLIQGHPHDYKMMLVALFLGLHEHPSFSERMYGLHDPLEVLREHLQRVRSDLESTFFADGMGTDYHTGETSLSDDDIVKASLPQLIEEIRERKGFTLFDEYDWKTSSWKVSLSKAIEYLNANVHSIKVQRTRYVINVAVELNDGEKFVVGTGTNNVFLMTNDDYRKLLNFLGHNILQPVLGDNPQENTLVVKAYYTRLKEKLFSVLDFFEERAAAMMDSGIFTTTQETPNFAARYFRKSWDNHRAIAEILGDLQLERYRVPLPRTFGEKSAILKEIQKAGLKPQNFF